MALGAQRVRPWGLRSRRPGWDEVGIMSEDHIERTRVFIENAMRQQCLSVDEAAKEIRELVPGDLVDGAVERIRELGRRNQLLKVANGASSLEYRQLTEEARVLRWYSGPGDDPGNWKRLHALMPLNGLDLEAVDVIDKSSTKVVSHLADPGIKGLRKKGLVVGYVQSGKTANYASVIAKAADAGYRLFIILAGMHNGLRQQTQLRLERDVVEAYAEPWVLLTLPNRDFGAVAQGPGLLSATELRNLAVIKKNVTRLRKVRDWLNAIPLAVRNGCPALIIDDEVDQATPNTKAAREEITAINRLIREILQALPTGGYIGYTATPFATVFLDPTDSEELYPSDFILDLPRPTGYFGAAELFGRSDPDEDGSMDDGYDMIRTIPGSEASSLQPPSAKERESFDPPAPETLTTAIRWFVLATAARWARGQSDRHSSMLVHTSQYVALHAAMADRVNEELAAIRSTPDENLHRELRDLWDHEYPRVPAHEFNLASVSFDSVEEHVDGVLAAVRVVIDNGSSDDRVDYSATEMGPDGVERTVPQTIIAVGGNTLSRGLTLEGLSVSYFCRSAATYDTLLQMGRWFGFRPGYADLPRIWTTAKIEDQFRFLASMEEDMRAEIARYEDEGVTPSQLGLKIRSHPDMAITAANKSYFAQPLQLSYGGRRFQTFRFTRTDSDVLDRNVRAARQLITDALAKSPTGQDQVEDARWIIRGVPKNVVSDFFASYQVHESHRQLERSLILKYLEERDDDMASRWDIAVIGRSGKAAKVDLGSIDLGLANTKGETLGVGDRVPMINRARLIPRDDPGAPDNVADIKSLMSRRDRFVGLEIPTSEWSTLHDEKELAQLRSDKAGGRGVLIVYPISPASEPMGVTGKTKTRTTLSPPSGVEAVIGFGVIFPDPVVGDSGIEPAYVALPPDMFSQDEYDDEEIALMGSDREADANIDGREYLVAQADGDLAPS